MADIGGRWRSAVHGAVVACFGLASVTAEARADRVVLRGGGQIKGKVQPDPKHPDRVSVLTERGKKPLSFQKAQIVQVVAEPGPLDDYLTKREATPPAAEAQYELGEWCEQHKLPDLAFIHYEAALRDDKTFAPAHRKLGHVRYEERWLTPDERREAQGLIRYKGRWITREENEQHEKDAATAAEQATWVRRIRLLREAIVYSSDDRQREAETQLMEIRDPIAIGPLVRVLGADNGRIRILLAHVLGSIPGPDATTALVARLIGEGEPDVRYATMDELLRRKEPEVTRVLVRALRSASPEVINRAAWGLANLHAVSAVPNLVGVLVTYRVEVVMVSAGGGSGDGLGISATFGSVPPSPSTGGVPVAYNGSSVGYLTGAAVGPNVAAYGASSLPTYSLPGPPMLPTPGLGFSPAGLGIPAGGGLSASRGPVPRMVRVPYRNSEVLSALVKLTGHDFGWDVDAWKTWVRTSYTSEPTPARRVPQP